MVTDVCTWYTPEEEVGGLQRWGSGLFTNTVVAQHGGCFAPQEPDREEEESEGNCICKEKSQWTSLASVGTPVQQVHPQNWGYE